MWEALADIAEDQDKTVNDVILELSRERPNDLNLSAEIRVFIVEFYRARFKGRPRPLQRANGRALAGRTVKVLLPE